MKDFFNKIEKKPVLITISLIAFQSLSFLFVKLFQSNYHVLESAVDNQIPFNKWWILIYCSWHILIFYIPYYLYKKDKNILAKYLVCYVASIIISSIIFIIYPTIVSRPTLQNDNILHILTNFIYWLDNPAINCLPSMHCAISMLFIFTIFTSKKTSKNMRIFILIISILIMISTLFVKQHVVIDIIAGDIMMTFIYFCVNNDKKVVNKVKKLLNI